MRTLSAWHMTGWKTKNNNALIIYSSGYCATATSHLLTMTESHLLL